jgi:NADPH-dependent methylglyoxal reductase
MVRSAAKAGTVRKLILTSSVAAIFDQEAPAGTVFTEEDWSPLIYEQGVYLSEQIAKTGDGSLLIAVYAAGKTLAEKALWDEVDKLGKPFPVATINPTFIFGPEILPGQHLASGTNAMFWGALNTRPLDQSAGNLGWVDVRDVAAAHYQALVDDKADGQRFMTSAKQATSSDLIDIALEKFSEKQIGFGKPDEVVDKSKWIVTDASKIEKVLSGFIYHDFEQSVVDFINAKLASQAA